MTTYGFTQLEQLWINAGGPRPVAPVAAAIALAESRGNPLAAYPGKTIAPGSGSWNDATGLWQILGAPSGHWEAGQLTDPVANAQMAVQKYRDAGNSFSPWQTYTDGSYRAFLSGAAPSAAGVPTGPSRAAPPPAPGAAGGGSQAGILGDLTGALAGAGTLMHDVAEALNFGLEFFKPGQMWRIGMGAGAAAAGVGAVRLYRSPSAGSGHSAEAPLAILLTGAALTGGYMALRPWPVGSGGRPIRPAAYVHEILGGHPPAGPPPADDTGAIEAGLWAVLGIWAASKVAGGLGNLAGGIGGILGGIFKWIKGLGRVATEVPVE